MSIAKGKERITITIHKETKKLLDILLSLHDESLTYSKLVEIAVLYYGQASLKIVNDLEKENENAKS